MALTDENNSGIGATMLVGPTNVPSYGYPMMMGGGFGGGFGGGGDWSWIIVLFLFAMMGGWGNGGMGFGFGGGLGYDFPWILNGQNGINNNVSDGFRDAQLHDSVTSVRDGVSNLSTQLCGCCGDMQMALANSTAGIQQSLCNGFAGTTAAITSAQNALSQQLNTNEIANLNRSFAEQTANTAGFTNVNGGIADLRYTVATEACADRAAVNDALRDVLTASTANTQRILDQLCNDKIDAKNERIADLERQLTMANLAASQTAQTARLERSNGDVIEGLYNRLVQCPIPSQPVYGSQAIFTCPQNNNGCGCSNGFAN